MREPQCALAMFTWVSCMHLNIYGWIFLGDESHGKGTLRVLWKEPFMGWGKVSASLNTSAHTQHGCPAPHHEWAEGLLVPWQTYKRLYMICNIKDFWQILLISYFGRYSPCIFSFTFKLCYNLWKEIKWRGYLLFLFPSQQYFVEAVLLSVKKNNP